MADIIESCDIKLKKKKLDHYLLVTPAKNEDNKIQTLINSIINQTHIPLIWIIIDDGSDDNTKLIIEKTASSFTWIHGLYLNTRETYDLEMHYSNLCQIGFKFAIEKITESKIKFDFIALSDADCEYPPDYFYTLIDYLNKNNDYGIVSGKMLIKKENNKIYSESSRTLGNEMPLGTGRLWRRKTFEETNGYLNVRAPDMVSNIVATNKGWKTKQLDDLFFFQTRDTGGKSTIWEGYYQRGKRAYYLSANIFCIFNTIIEITLISRQKNSINKSLAYIIGFFHSFLHKEPQISIDCVNEYMGSYRRVFAQYIKFLKTVLKHKKSN